MYSPVDTSPKNFKIDIIVFIVVILAIIYGINYKAGLKTDPIYIVKSSPVTEESNLPADYIGHSWELVINHINKKFPKYFKTDYKVVGWSSQDLSQTSHMVTYKVVSKSDERLGELQWKVHIDTKEVVYQPKKSDLFDTVIIK